MHIHVLVKKLLKIEWKALSFTNVFSFQIISVMKYSWKITALGITHISRYDVEHNRHFSLRIFPFHNTKHHAVYFNLKSLSTSNKVMLIFCRLHWFVSKINFKALSKPKLKMKFNVSVNVKCCMEHWLYSINKMLYVWFYAGLGLKNRDYWRKKWMTHVSGLRLSLQCWQTLYPHKVAKKGFFSKYLFF